MKKRELQQNQEWFHPAKRPIKAYRDMEFIDSPEARPVRILAEFLEPEVRFKKFNISDTIVFFGSARLVSTEKAQQELKQAKEDVKKRIPSADERVRKA